VRTVNKSALVPYTAAQMYALVNDVRHYPSFALVPQRAHPQ